MNQPLWRADATKLGSQVTSMELEALCHFALENADVVRAVCIDPRPEGIFCCKKILEDKMDICVVNDFPFGKGGIETKRSEALLAKKMGAKEIDTVINPDLVRAGDFIAARNEIEAVVEIFPGRTKVILETGHAWYTEELIKEATRTLREAGAFCAKTSTGKVANLDGARLEEKVKHAIWMHEAATNLMIKAAGGIKTMADAQLFIDKLPSSQLIFGASAAFWKTGAEKAKA